MAVEAKNLSIYSPQILTNTDFISSNQANAYAYNAQIPSVANFSTAMAENFSPFHQSLLCDSVQAKNSMKADSGLTCNLPAPRKRSRDSFEQFNDSLRTPPKNNPIEFSSFLGEDISFQIQQQQLEIDHIVALHVILRSSLFCFSKITVMTHDEETSTKYGDIWFDILVR